MPLLANELPAVLPTPQQVPCLSLYQPTHRTHPDNLQDLIRFRNLLRELEHSLLQKYSSRDVRLLLEPFRELGSQPEFWNHALDGLAVLCAPGVFQVYKLQRPVPELAIVADSFHTKPLLRILQSADRYQVLALTKATVKLFEGNRDALDEVDLEPEVPRTINEMAGEEKNEPPQTVASYAGVGSANVGMHHGHASKKEVDDIAVDRFFRAVDRAILEHHSKPSGLPLLLAALPEHHSVFRKISHNPFLMPDGLTIHPDALSTDELRKRAWSVFEPRYQARITQTVDEFSEAKPTGLAHDDLAEVASAAVYGRVKALLIEAEKEIPGHIESATGRIQFRDLNHPEVDDLLDDLGELVLSKGGRVAVVPANRMPTGTGAAAVYRY